MSKILLLLKLKKVQTLIVAVLIVLLSWFEPGIITIIHDAIHSYAE